MKFELHYLEKYIILSVIICVLIISGGYSLAYFTSTGGVKGEGVKMSTSTGEVPRVEFDGGSSKIDLTGEKAIVPGTKIDKEFSVTVSSISDSISTVTYYIHFDISTNDFTKCTKSGTNNCQENAQELVYSLYKKGSNGELEAVPLVGPVDLTNGVKETNPYKVECESNGKTDYVLRLEFKDTGQEQNHNEGKSFVANIDVTFNESKAE